MHESTAPIAELARRYHLSKATVRKWRQRAEVGDRSHRLNALREAWLNPPEWVDRVPEIVPGYPDRLIPKPAHAAELKKRTLTNLYNARPAWLDHAHQALDVAVAAAYGWAGLRAGDGRGGDFAALAGYKPSAGRGLRG